MNPDRASSAPSPARRVIVSVAAVAAVLAARWFPLPFVDPEAYRLFMGPLSWVDPVLSPVSLGLVPFIGGFLLVELVAQAHPALRPLRHGAARQRERLTRAAWAVALGLAALQGWGIATYLQTLRGVNGIELVKWGFVPCLAIAGTLVAGTLATAGLAVLVSRHGLGNGFALLFAVDAFGALVRLGRSSPCGSPR